MTAPKYDPTKNARGCYEAAIAEIRIRGVRSGKFEPINKAERDIARQAEEQAK